ncbi:hypothetical protein SEPCBS119000_006381 [Sporothrix epigloea]|uniref:Uncharacterized protein n=1 Tax=Sporothrix epigloea TaxID=1892477 RepID=A0ABP0E609_9PEZI
MSDISSAAPQLLAAKAKTDREIDNDENDSRPAGLQAGDSKAAPEPASEVGPASPTQNEPQQKNRNMRPRAHGRPKRFMRKNNTPYIQQPSSNDTGESPDAPTDSNREEDEIVTSVQVPDHITLDSTILHGYSPELPPESEPATAQNCADRVPNKKKKRPAPLALVKNTGAPAVLAKSASKTAVKVSSSPPRRRHQPLHLAGSQDSRTTLYQILMLVNRTLAVEMKKNANMRRALDVPAQGPLHNLGLLGQFVRLLFRAKSEYQKTAWRFKRDVTLALQQQENWVTGDSAAAPPAPVFRGALAMYSVPFDQADHVPPPIQASAQDSASESGEGEEEEDVDRERYSAFTIGVAREDGAVSDNDSDKDNLVWQAIKRADRRHCAAAVAARKRSYEELFASDEDESSSATSSEEGGAHELDYLAIASPSLPAREKLADLLRQFHESNARRFETYTIIEQPAEEEALNRNQKREARAMARKNRQARAELVKEMRKEADADVQRRLATLTDERDVALQIAEKAVYEREDQRILCAALRKDSEQLHRMKDTLARLRLYVASIHNNKSAALPSKTPITAEKTDRVLPFSPAVPNRLPMRDFRQQLRSLPTTPLPLTMPNTPKSPWPLTPAVSVCDSDRGQTTNEVQHVPRERPPMAPPSTPAFASFPPAKRGFPAAVTVAYRIDTIRAPLGSGFWMTTLDVLFAIWLILARQAGNMSEVLRWVRYVLLELAHFALSELVAAPWKWLRQTVRRLSKKQAKSQSSTALVPTARSTTSRVLWSRVIQHVQVITPSTRMPFVPFPRDAVAELILVAISLLFVSVCVVVVIAAATERKFWQTANSFGKPQQWFTYFYLPRYRKDKGRFKSSSVSLLDEPYQVCGCVYTGVDLRMIQMLFGYLWASFRSQLTEIAR